MVSPDVSVRSYQIKWLGDAMLTQTLCNEMQSDPCKSRLGVMSSHILEPTASRSGAVLQRCSGGGDAACDETRLAYSLSPAV